MFYGLIFQTDGGAADGEVRGWEAEAEDGAVWD